jgi:beta-phosphoglucomutase-like phosphatase (HAD superfamily)
VIVAADGAFGDAEGVFAEGVAHLARKLGPIRPLDPATIPHARADAIAALDQWDASGSWRTELVRFYESHAPVLLRPDPALNALLRQARRRGIELTVSSPLPREAAERYLAQLGVLRSIARVAGEEDGPPAAAISTRAELERALSPG